MATATDDEMDRRGLHERLAAAETARREAERAATDAENRALEAIAEANEHDGMRVAAESRAARAEAALRDAQERLDRIDAFAGERCEASGCRPDPCGPVEYHDVEGVPLCAECWQECVEEDALAARGERGE